MGRREDAEKFEENMRRGKKQCMKCCSFIGSTIVFLYFAMIVTLPTCSIEEFYVPDLNKAVNTSAPANTIFFDIKLNNKNKAKGAKYAPINLTFYYGSDTSFPIGNYIIPSFYQGIKKNTHRTDIVDTHGVPWKTAARLVSNGSTASFRVGLSTSVRFKFLGILYKKHKMGVGATVQVDNSGEKVSKDGIKFKSGATSLIRGGLVGLLAVVVVVALVI